MYSVCCKEMVVQIACDTQVVFVPLPNMWERYRSRDALSIKEIVALLLLKSELKNCPLHIVGQMPLVNKETSKLLAEIADQYAHSVDQTDKRLTNEWHIQSRWLNEQEAEAECRLELIIGSRINNEYDMNSGMSDHCGQSVYGSCFPNRPTK